MHQKRRELHQSGNIFVYDVSHYNHKLIFTVFSFQCLCTSSAAIEKGGYIC